MSASLAFRGIVKRYGTVTAVDGVDLAVAPGELIALLGPSGSGKTTLLMMLAGLEQPTAGAIEVDGHDIAPLPANRRNLGMVFQRYTLFPHMTVADNVAFPLQVRGVPAAERARRVARVLEIVRLAEYGGRMPRQLSGGQQQRVALARALVYDPPVLLMDEPFAALDRKLRIEMQHELRRIRAELGLTVVFVTHDQEEAMRLADKVAILARGRVQQVGAPREIYERPTNPFVAGFIGNVDFVPATRVETERLRISGRDMAWPGLTAGAGPMQLALRPEQTTLVAADDPEALFSAQVEDAIFLGEQTSVTLAAADGTRITTLLPAGAALPVIGTRHGVRLRAGAMPSVFEADHG